MLSFTLTIWASSGTYADWATSGCELIRVQLQAKAELEKAERSHRRNPAMCCIIALSIALGIMTLILILKIFGYVDI